MHIANNCISAKKLNSTFCIGKTTEEERKEGVFAIDYVTNSVPDLLAGI